MRCRSRQNTSHKTPFTLLDVGVVFIFIAAVFLLFQLRIINLGFLIWNERVDYSVRMLHVFLLQEALFLIPVITLMIVRYRSSCIQSCGFFSFHFWKAFRSIIGWYLFYLLVMYVISQFSQWLQVEIPGFGEGRSILPLFGQDKSTIVVLVLVVVCIAPLVEEMFFRGFLFLTLLKKSHYVVASCMTAFVFAAIHLDFGAFIPRFVLGLILNQIVMENNRSIIPAIMFHVMNNGITLLVTLVVTS